MKNSPILVESLMDKIPSVISCGSNHTIAVTEDGEAYGWGHGKYGANGTGMKEDVYAPAFIRFEDVRRPNIVHVSCGVKHSALVDDSGRVYTCGNSEAGQLGYGEKEQQNTP